MTVSEMLTKMSSYEITEWIAYYNLLDFDQKNLMQRQDSIKMMKTKKGRK